MNNPFEVIEERLNAIEALLLSLGERSQEQSEQTVKEELFDVQEAANFLKLTPDTIYTKVSRGELPVMKRGKRLYFSSTELLAYLKEGRKKTVSETDRAAEEYMKKRL